MGKVITFPGGKRQSGTQQQQLSAVAPAQASFQQTQNQKQVQQSITGNHNLQFAAPVGSVTIRTTKARVPDVIPPPGSIGASVGLRQRIDGLLKEIEQHRQARMGKAFRRGVIHGQLAKEFGFKPVAWRSIWLLDATRAPEVIDWLETKRDNTQGGRIAKASRRDGTHTRGHLFRVEKGYLAQLGWNEDEARFQRHLVIGKDSRAEMTDNEFRNWVAHLGVEVRRIYGE